VDEMGTRKAGPQNFEKNNNNSLVRRELHPNSSRRANNPDLIVTTVIVTLNHNRSGANFFPQFMKRMR
jgi:hypothetical protein